MEATKGSMLLIKKSYPSGIIFGWVLLKTTELYCTSKLEEGLSTVWSDVVLVSNNPCPDIKKEADEDKRGASNNEDIADADSLVGNILSCSVWVLRWKEENSSLEEYVDGSEISSDIDGSKS